MFSTKILSVGYECELLRLRSLLLTQSLGVEVFETVDLASALRIARGKERVDLVVLCHTVSTAHQGMIMEAVREQRGDVPVLSICPGIFVAGTVGSPVTNDPEEFVAAVKQALHPGRYKRAKRALNLFTKESLSERSVDSRRNLS